MRVVIFNVQSLGGLKHRQASTSTIYLVVLLNEYKMCNSNTIWQAATNCQSTVGADKEPSRYASKLKL